MTVRELWLAAVISYALLLDGGLCADSTSLGGFAATFTNSTVAVVTWIDGLKAGGSAYELSYVLDGKQIARRTADRYYVITGLQSNTNYSIKVKRLSGGSGSELIGYVQTQKAVPSTAPKFTNTVELSDSVISMQWSYSDPSVPTVAVTMYQVILENERRQTQLNITGKISSTFQSRFDSLESFSYYNATARAYSKDGPGPLSLPITLQTKESRRPKNVDYASNATAVTVRWMRGNPQAYVITYRVWLFDMNTNYSVNTTELSCTFTGLRPGTFYPVIVGAYPFVQTDVALGMARTTAATAAPPGALPLIDKLSVVSTNSSSLQVYWVTTSSASGSRLAASFLVRFTSPNCQYSGSRYVAVARVEFADMLPYCYYDIDVSACAAPTDCGTESTLKRITTQQRAPDAAPQKVGEKEKNATSVYLTWEDISVSKKNGVITRFVLRLSPSTACRVLGDSSNYSTTTDSILLSGLKPYCYYNVSAAGCTSAGCGPYSEPYQFTTLQAVPAAAPERISVIANTSTSLALTWTDIPDDLKNGIIVNFGLRVTPSEKCGQAFWDVNTTSGSLFYSLINLKPNCNYSVTVRGCTTAGCGLYSKSYQFITLTAVPTGFPTRFAPVFRNSTALSLSWSAVPEAENGGFIDEYLLVIQPEPRCGTKSEKRVNSLAVVLGGLPPYCLYSIDVRGCNKIGCGPATSPLNVRTEEAAPDAAPQKIGEKEKNATSVYLTWEDISVGRKNGVITRFVLLLSPSAPCRVLGDSSNYSTTTNSILLSGLKPYCYYNVSAAGCTSAGCGPYSESYRFTTLQAVPGAAPQSISVLGNTSTSLALTWADIPDEVKNGIIVNFGLRVTPSEKCGQAFWDVNTTSGSLFYSLINLKPNCNYSVTVRGCTTAGCGPYSDSNRYLTLTEAPTGFPKGFALAFSNSTTLLLTWNAVPEAENGGLIADYLLIIQPAPGCGSRTEKRVSAVTAALSDLAPYCLFSVYVRGCNKIGCGPAAGPANFSTEQAAPAAAPRGINHLTKSSTEVTLSWSEIPSGLRNGVIISFAFQVVASGKCASVVSNVKTTSGSLSYPLTNLKPNCNYSVSVSGCTIAGCGPYSDPYGFTTPPAAPSGFANGLSLTASNSTALALRWNNVSEAESGGLTVYYLLAVQPAPECGKKSEARVSSLSVVLGNLKPYCLYSIDVRGCNAVGCGPFTDPRNFTTEQAAPQNAPVGVEVTFTNSTVLELRWRKMIEEVGIVNRYELLCEPLYECWFQQRSANISTNLTSSVFADLKPYCYYKISVKGCTSAGCGPAAEIDRIFTTQSAPAGPPSNFTILRLSPQALSVQWGEVKESDRNGIITYYQVLLYNDATMMQRNVTPQDNFTSIFYELIPDTMYTILAKAHTAGGASNYSIIFNITTPYDPPGEAPANVTILRKTSSAVTLFWQMPSGRLLNMRIFQYELYFSTANQTLVLMNVIVNSTNATVTETVVGLTPATNYSVVLVGRNLYGNSPPSKAVYFVTELAGTRCQDSFYGFSAPSFNFLLQESDIGSQINISVCDDDGGVLLAARCQLNLTSQQPEFIITADNRTCSRQRLEVHDRFQTLKKRSTREIIQDLANFTSQVTAMSSVDIAFIYDLLDETSHSILESGEITYPWDLASDYGKVLSNFMDVDSVILSSANSTLRRALSPFEAVLASVVNQSVHSPEIKVPDGNFRNFVYKFPQNSTTAWMCECWQDGGDNANSWTAEYNCTSFSQCDQVIYPSTREEIEWFTAFRNDKLFATSTGSKERRAAQTAVLGLRRTTAAPEPRVEFRLKTPRDSPWLSCAVWDSENQIWLTENCSQTCTSDSITCTCNATEGDYFTAVKFNGKEDPLPAKDSGCWRWKVGNSSTSSNESEILNSALKISSLASVQEHMVEIEEMFTKMEKIQLNDYERSDLEQISIVVSDILSKLMDAEDVNSSVANSATKQMETVLLSLANSVRLQSDTGRSYFNKSTSKMAYKVSAERSQNGISTCEFLDLPLTGRAPSRIELNEKLAGEAKAFIIYVNDKLFKDVRGKNNPLTEILGAQVGGNLSAVTSGENVVTSVFPLAQKVEVGKFVCAYWNYTSSSWHTDGCKTTSNSSDKSVTCGCNHLTHFAVLLNPHYVESEELTMLTMIGLGLSTCCLGFVMVTFILFRRMRKNDSQKTLFSLSMSLLALNLFFLAGIDRTEGEGICTAMAMLIHYFLLTSFAWTLVEAVLQYFRLVKVLGSYVSSFMLKASLPAWGVPAVIVAVIYGANQDSYLRYETSSGSEKWLSSCWVSQPVLYYGVIAPVGCVIFINTVMFSIIMYSLSCRKRLRSNVSDHKLAMLHLKAGVSIFVLLGITWVIGFIGMTDGHASLAFQAIFCVLCTLTGVFIAIFHNLRERAVRDQWRTLCCAGFKAADASGSSSDAKSTSKQHRASTSTIDVSIGNVVVESHPLSGRVRRESSQFDQ